MMGVHSVADMIRSPGNIVIPHKVKKGFRHWVWKPPVSGKIKVNVDGSFLGGSDRGGIEGLFRYLKGRVLV